MTGEFTLGNLTFVAHSLIYEGQCRAACYLCGWWSDWAENTEHAQTLLLAHTITPEHAALVRDDVVE